MGLSMDSSLCEPSDGTFPRSWRPSDTAETSPVLELGQIGRAILETVLHRPAWQILRRNPVPQISTSGSSPIRNRDHKGLPCHECVFPAQQFPPRFSSIGQQLRLVAERSAKLPLVSPSRLGRLQSQRV